MMETAGTYFQEIDAAYKKAGLTSVAIFKAPDAEVAKYAAGKKINYEGASGQLEFDENGDVTGAIGHFIIENGQFKEVGLIAP